MCIATLHVAIRSYNFMCVTVYLFTFVCHGFCVLLYGRIAFKLVEEDNW